MNRVPIIQDGIPPNREIICIILENGESVFFDEFSFIAEIKHLQIRRIERIPIGTPRTRSGGEVGNGNIFSFTAVALFAILATVLLTFYFIKPSATDDSKRPKASTSQHIQS
ncbi:hypothetical protein PseudUWO311_09840 [Pseudanabaena sp. UWO311]|uniref:hypothetical protein n=1 Tax=Pseudanabaena sp. UWO311 TaxID=2487337 RepID=UPI0011581009|nr:hypothetical protein [Pseudanabaena sp. UWO311]TYQ26978.1 hypothetical protein PseudUWO311_09840 [Pseudanabaena sp. UWO311]